MGLRFFKPEDFRCLCGRPECDAPAAAMPLLMKLDGLRLELGEPIYISSGSRCRFRNEAVGGAPDSMHLRGLAADIPCPNGDYAYRLVKLGIKHGFTGIGIGKHFVHLDARPGLPTLFGYQD